MFCSKCGTKIELNQKFCSKCGMRLRNPADKIYCKKCVSPLEENQKFCQKCGMSYTNPSNENARRKWTKEEINEYRKIHGLLFYCNKQDSNIFVPKTYGYGWNINWAKLVSWF